jgi:hypothetical protein
MMQELQKQNLFSYEFVQTPRKFPSVATLLHLIFSAKSKTILPSTRSFSSQNSNTFRKYEIPACNPTNLPLSLSLSRAHKNTHGRFRRTQILFVRTWNISNFLFNFKKNSRLLSKATATQFFLSGLIRKLTVHVFGEIS